MLMRGFWSTSWRFPQIPQWTSPDLAKAGKDRKQQATRRPRAARSVRAQHDGIKLYRFRLSALRIPQSLLRHGLSRSISRASCLTSEFYQTRRAASGQKWATGAQNIGGSRRTPLGVWRPIGEAERKGPRMEHGLNTDEGKALIATNHELSATPCASASVE
jgi:hypothetical protein